MTNRQRVAEDLMRSVKLAAEIEDYNAMMVGVFCVMASELAGLNDELHALNLKIDKLTKEVGKRK